MSFKVNFKSSQIIEKLCMNLEGKIKKIIKKYMCIYINLELNLKIFKRKRHPEVILK